MLGLLFETSDLGSVFLGAGLFALCAGFALEAVRTRDRQNVALSIVCASALVSTATGLITPVTVATYMLLGVQIGGVVFLFLLFHQWRRSPTTSPR